jgi:mevalonate kinase
VLISGFGGGLSASAGIITLDPNAYYKFFQYEGKNEETATDKE